MTGRDLAEELHTRALAGAYRELALAGELDLDGFESEPNDCHGNARKWTDLHPGHNIVRGFLIVGECIFNKHSVIETGRPELLDITPRPPNESVNLLRFIEFDGGSSSVFEAMENQVIYTPRA